MANLIDGQERLDWRNPASYRPLLDLDRSGWAWEFLRRNPDYRKAVQSLPKPTQERWLMPPLSLISAVGISPEWGCPFAAPPDNDALAAPPFWLASVDPSVLPVAVISPHHTEDAFDVMDLGQVVTVFRDRGGTEHVQIGRPPRPIRLHVETGTVLRGPVALHASLAGCAVQSRLRTLRRLLDLQRRGRQCADHDGPDARGARLAFILQVLDGHDAGASQREIGIALFGKDRVREDWNGYSDYLRSRICRAIKAGQALRDRGYRNLLRGLPSRPAAANDNDVP
ncbi:DUF2285 domain-containing protein [Sphingobium cloacae]|uniref:DUF2285 domain-containing protein n=1 Tax=Sphingobium cloacae TaxID=120107 RepID=A0A1E1F0U9_9SPHN|nr:DUF2285 domain-containing protein [Sphingobium cloacae]BAV64081.1 hypothetical protein SCLO_1010410 [Sphingobium cloacae]